MGKNIVLGLDPGTRITGFAVVQKERSHLTLLHHGAIIIPTKLSLPDKYYSLSHEVELLLEQWYPTSVAIEGQFVNLNPQAALKIAMAKASALVACGKSKISVSEYSPSVIKLAVTGSGKSSKSQVSWMVKSLLQCDIASPTYDVTDAIAIAICHLQRSQKVESIC